MHDGVHRLDVKKSICNIAGYIVFTVIKFAGKKHEQINQKEYLMTAYQSVVLTVQ